VRLGGDEREPSARGIATCVVSAGGEAPPSTSEQFQRGTHPGIALDLGRHRAGVQIRGPSRTSELEIRFQPPDQEDARKSASAWSGRRHRASRRSTPRFPRRAGCRTRSSASVDVTRGSAHAIPHLVDIALAERGLGGGHHREHACEAARYGHARQPRNGHAQTCTSGVRAEGACTPEEAIGVRGFMCQLLRARPRRRASPGSSRRSS
jgi:hypothetical protein